jgi:hypothetical protein
MEELSQARHSRFFRSCKDCKSFQKCYPPPQENDPEWWNRTAFNCNVYEKGLILGEFTRASSNSQ